MFANWLKSQPLGVLITFCIKICAIKISHFSDKKTVMEQKSVSYKNALEQVFEPISIGYNFDFMKSTLVI